VGGKEKGKQQNKIGLEIDSVHVGCLQLGGIGILVKVLLMRISLIYIMSSRRRVIGL
jgi:hypothetical protein